MQQADDREPRFRGEVRLPVSGITTPVWEYGGADVQEGSPSVLMIHGFRGTHDGLDLVARSLIGHRVFVPDLPGFGAAEDLPSGDDVAGYAAWTAQLWTALGLGPADILFGHSFGTIIVAASADRVDALRLVLMNPIAVPSARGPHPLLSRGAGFLYSMARRAPEPIARWLLTNRLHVRGMSIAMAKTRDPALRRWIHAQHDEFYNRFASISGVCEGFAESSRRSVGEYLSHIVQSCLLICGEQDDIATPAQEVSLLAALPADSRLIMLREVGHLIHYERPADAARAIDRFLADYTPS